MLREQRHGMEKAKITAAAEEKVRIGQRIKLEIRPQILEIEKEYWGILANQAESLDITEQEAEVVVSEIVIQVEQIEARNPPRYPDQVLELLREIKYAVNQPGKPASAKLKGIISSFPPFIGVAYEAELDTESFVLTHFPTFTKVIKQMTKKNPIPKLLWQQLDLRRLATENHQSST